MNYSPTPETDKAEDSDPMVEGEWHWIVPSSFARRLERERDEARKDLVALEELHRRRFGTLRKELAASNRGAETNAKVNQGLCSRLTEAERERDEARRELDAVLQRLSLWEGAVMRMKKQLSFAPPFHQGIASQEEA
jgi:chromosome segregation ATPase